MDVEIRPIDHVLRGTAGPVALIDREGVLDFAAAERAVAGMAGWLLEQGLSAGDRVATWLPKTRDACLMPLAAPRAGLVHVPINPALRRAQVAHILEDSGASMLLSQAGRGASLEADDVPEGCRVVDGLGIGPAVGPSDADPDRLAAILYTSGSTGRAKGVMLSHANLWLGAVSVASYLKLSPADRVLAVLPLAFDYGQNQLFSSWFAGASVAPIDYLTARDVVKAVERTGATTLAGVPPLWTQLLEADWPAETAAKLKRLTNSGGAMTEKLVRGVRSTFFNAEFFAMYGLTEAFRSTFLDSALIDTHFDAIGREIPHANIMVVRPDGGRAKPGEPGELVHAGPLVAQGYWGDPERTAQRFRPAPAFAAYGGNAVWSGDTVIEGADGLLRFVGRDDEMIKSAGNRISPGEVEEAITAGDEVREAVAIGVADVRMGQVIVAVVAGDPADEPALRQRLRGLLPGFMQPARYEWREALPRNANGKLDRAAIRREVIA
ncbi:MAG TPA: AMP-binding protein [Sphingomonas sp.]|nr:AMP-binding protein [Sphingomonas sp.]